MFIAGREIDIIAAIQDQRGLHSGEPSYKQVFKQEELHKRLSEWKYQ